MTGAHRFVALIAMLTICHPASAAPITLNALDTGWYTSDGEHDEFNANYIVGKVTQTYRNFAVFDLSDVAEPITSATLRLTNFANRGAFISPDPTENYVLYDVTTTIPQLRAGGSGLVSHYNDLGEGVVFGSHVASEADNGTVVEIPLNAAALAEINSASGDWAIGGAITTLDSASTAREYLFGDSGRVSDVRQLVLTVAPEPLSLSALGVAGIVVCGRRRR